MHSTNAAIYSPFSHAAISLLPVLIYCQLLYKNRISPTGSRHSTNRLYLAANPTSKRSNAKNIRDIPQPGHSNPVNNRNTQGIPQPVSFTKTAYPAPTSRTIPTFFKSVYRRFFSSKPIFLTTIKEGGTYHRAAMIFNLQNVYGLQSTYTVWG